MVFVYISVCKDKRKIEYVRCAFQCRHWHKIGSVGKRHCISYSRFLSSASVIVLCEMWKGTQMNGIISIHTHKIFQQKKIYVHFGSTANRRMDYVSFRLRNTTMCAILSRPKSWMKQKKKSTITTQKNVQWNKRKNESKRIYIKYNTTKWEKKKDIKKRQKKRTTTAVWMIPILTSPKIFSIRPSCSNDAYLLLLFVCHFYYKTTVYLYQLCKRKNTETKQKQQQPNRK